MPSADFRGRLDIRSEGGWGVDTEILLDGRKLPRVRSVTLYLDACDLHRAVVEFAGLPVNARLPVHFHLDLGIMSDESLSDWWQRIRPSVLGLLS